MKKILIVFFALLQFPLLAQSPDVENVLKSKYSLVQFSEDCGGWYLLSYNKTGQQLYGFADSRGNVVATDASQYKIHPGYIELYLLDMVAKSKHDQWILDCKSYDRAYREYLKVNKEFEAELEAYKTKYAAAKQEATYRWKKAQEYARKKAEMEAAQLQRQSSGTSILGAVLSGIAGGISVAAAVNAVKFEPYLNQVLGERDLLVEPSKPYNPEPKKPIEPPTGYYWKSFSLKQPDRYEYIDFAAISESGRFADVKCDGKWGLVDSRMNEVIPCASSTKVLQTSYEDGKFLVRSQGKYGVITSKGKYVLPLQFASIERYRTRFKVSTVDGYGLYSDEGKKIIPCEYQQIDQQLGYWLCCKDGAWGVFTRDFDELYPCQFQDAKLVSNSGKLMLYNKSKGLWGAIDFLAGTELLPNNYSSIEYSSHDGVGLFYKVCSDSQYGLYSHKGIVVIPCAYSDITFKQVANNMMIEVKKGAKNVGLYEPSGIQVLSADKYTSYIHEGSYYKVVDTNNNMGICDLYGTELVPCQYTSLKYNDRIKGFIASKGASKGVVSFTGRELFPFVNVNSLDVYPRISQEMLVVGNGEEKGYGFIDYDGNIIVPMKNKFGNLYKKVGKAVKKYPAIPDKSLAKRETLSGDLGQKLQLEEKEYQERRNFSFFAQNYVERVVGEWQKKGEFEKLDDWRKRVNHNTLNQRVFALTKEAQAIYVDDCKKELPTDNPRIVGSYDPDNETYRISTSYSDEDILVKVDTKDALEFKSSFNSLRKQPEFFVENDRIGLAEYVFTMPNGNKYKYSNQASLSYSVANVKYNLESIEIDKSALNSVKKGKQTISTSTFMFGTSDVDVNIPVSEHTRPNTFALIIANENYDNERKVDYAYNDGQVLRDYCLKTLGIPADNIHFRPDATLNNMKFEMGWLKTVTKAYPDAKVLVYYAGHGMPDEYTRDSYLLPVDGHSSDIKTTGYRLSELYASLGELPADNVLVMLDACFSGVDRTGESITNVRGVKVVPKKDRPSGNMIVFSATSGQQAANPYVEQSHGFFTYYLLKKLKETGGNVNYGDWFDYIRTNVAQKAVVTIQREQTPTVMPSASVAGTWKAMTL